MSPIAHSKCCHQHRQPPRQDFRLCRLDLLPPEALKAGATGLKLFPGDMAGPNGLKAMRAILPIGTKVYAVGGTAPDNFSKWVEASANGFGLGTAIYKPGDTAEIVTIKAGAIVKAYDSI